MVSRARIRRRLPLLAVAACVFLLVLYPLARLVWVSLFPASGPGLAELQRALTDPLSVKAVWGTIWLTGMTVVIAVPVGTLIAGIVAATDAPWVRQLELLPLLAFALPPLVGAIGWLMLLAPRVGLANLVVRRVFGLHIEQGPFNAYTIPVLVMTMVLFVVPFVYAPVFAALRNLDAGLDEAARIAGASRWTSVVTVLLPVVRPAILTATLIAGVVAASTFVFPLVLAGGTGIHVIPTLVYQAVTQEGRPAVGTALASVLSVFTVLGLLFHLRLMGRASYATVSGRSRRLRIRLGRWRWPATGTVLAFLVLAIGLPLAGVVYVSLVGYWGADMLGQPLSLDQYALALRQPSAARSLLNSATFAAVAATAALLLGFAVGSLQQGRPGVLARATGFVAMFPLGVPAIVLGLAVLVAYINPPLVLYGSAAILVVGYCAHVLPIATRNSDTALRQFAVELAEAGRVAGGTGATVLRGIVLPLLRDSLIATWALVFILCFQEVPVSILLYTPGTLVAPIALLNAFDEGSVAVTAALAVVMTVVSTSMVLFAARFGRGKVDSVGLAR